MLWVWEAVVEHLVSPDMSDEAVIVEHHNFVDVFLQYLYFLRGECDPGLVDGAADVVN